MAIPKAKAGARAEKVGKAGEVSEKPRPKIRGAKFTTTMSFTEAEMRIFDELKAVLGSNRITVMRIALRDYAQKLGVNTRAGVSVR